MAKCKGSGNHLVPMPTEMILKFFCHLTSLSEVLALAAVNRALRLIWTGNITHIYYRVAPQSISCEHHARRFREDQRGSCFESGPMGVPDVICIARNARIVEKAIVQFEREIVCKVKGNGMPELTPHALTFYLANGYRLSDFYGVGARRHPSHLTPTERRRFIRSYYQFWGLMKLSSTALQKRLESQTLKRLYHLYEASRLTQDMGEEEMASRSQDHDVGPASTTTIHHRRSRERVALEKKIWKHLEYAFHEIHHENAEYVWEYAKEEGFLSSLVVWDHWQPSLREICCQGFTTGQQIDFQQRYLWSDSSDEDI